MGGDEVQQARAHGGAPSGEGGTGQTIERMMEMMRLQAEQLQILAASTSSLRKEVEHLKSGKGKEPQPEEKEEAIPPLSVARVEKMENAPHLPRWMARQCRLPKELLGVLGEDWLAEDMEGVEGGARTDALDCEIVIVDPEDWGTP